MGWYVQVMDRWIMSKLDDGEFRLLCLLAKYGRKTGVCDLGTSELCRVLRISDREVRRRLGGLEEKGYIERQYKDESRSHLGGIALTEWCGAKRMGPPAEPSANGSLGGPGCPPRRTARPDRMDRLAGRDRPPRRTAQPDRAAGPGCPPATIEERTIGERTNQSNKQGGGTAPSEREYPPDVEGDRIAAEAREVAREWDWPDGVVEWAADMAPLKDDWPMFRAALIHGAVARDRIVKDGKQVASPERLIESKYRQFEDQGRAPADPIRPDSRRAAEEAESLHRRMYPLYRAPRDPEREAKQRSFEEKLRVRRAGGGA